MTQASQLADSFGARYGTPSRVFRAPGRVNLIGEHTDYNDGFVLPAAIGFFTWVAVAPSDDRRIVVHSENFSETVSFDLDDVRATPDHWSNYLRGITWALQEKGHALSGLNVLVRGEVPIGSGLSSSAAIEVSFAYAVSAVQDLGIGLLALAQLCQRAESEFVGMRCGIMDQFVSCHGKAGCALMLDCRSLHHDLLPLAKEMSLVICNTGVKHELAASEYNQRRSQCEEGVRQLQGKLPNIRALRDVVEKDLEKHGSDLRPLVLKRCRHVVTENTRVQSAVTALRQKDFATVGRLMNDSHRSLRDDYQVSCVELDLMVEIASQIEGLHGARMTGGGFGGCTINLVETGQATSFKDAMTKQYEKRTGICPEIYICRAAEGAGEIDF